MMNVFQNKTQGCKYTGEERWLFFALLCFCWEIPLKLTPYYRFNPTFYDLAFVIGLFVFGGRLLRPVNNVVYNSWKKIVFLFSFCSFVYFFLTPFDKWIFSALLICRYLQGLLFIKMMTLVKSDRIYAIITKAAWIGLIIINIYSCYEVFHPEIHTTVLSDTKEVTLGESGSVYGPLYSKFEQCQLIPLLVVICLSTVSYQTMGIFSSISRLFGTGSVFSANGKNETQGSFSVNSEGQTKSLISNLEKVGHELQAPLRNASLVAFNGFFVIVLRLFVLFLGWSVFASNSRTSLVVYLAAVSSYVILRKEWKSLLVVLLFMFVVTTVVPKAPNIIEDSMTVQRFITMENDDSFREKNGVKSRIEISSLNVLNSLSYDNIFLLPFVGAGFNLAPIDGAYRIDYGIHSIYLYPVEQAGVLGGWLFLSFLIVVYKRIILVYKSSLLRASLAAMTIAILAAGLAGQIFWQGFGTGNFNTLFIGLLCLSVQKENETLILIRRTSCQECP